jgi:hypothetical protein
MSGTCRSFVETPLDYAKVNILNIWQNLSKPVIQETFVDSS